MVGEWRGYLANRYERTAIEALGNKFTGRGCTHEKAQIHQGGISDYVAISGNHREVFTVMIHWSEVTETLVLSESNTG